MHWIYSIYLNSNTSSNLIFKDNLLRIKSATLRGNVFKHCPPKFESVAILNKNCLVIKNFPVADNKITYF